MPEKQDYEYRPEKDAWVCYDNNPATAQYLKQLHPYDVVLLYDRNTRTYTRYYITISIPRPNMAGGKLLFEDEEVQV